MGRKSIFADKKKADAVVKEYLTGMTAEELATAFDCSVPTVYKLLRDRKVKTRRGRASEFTPEERAKVVELYKAGSPTRDIAEMAACSAPTINKILVAEGVKIRPRGRREGSGKPKPAVAKPKANRSKRDKNIASGAAVKVLKKATAIQARKAKAARRPAPGKPRPARPKRKAKARARKA